MQFRWTTNQNADMEPPTSQLNLPPVASAKIGRFSNSPRMHQSVLSADQDRLLKRLNAQPKNLDGHSYRSFIMDARTPDIAGSSLKKID